MQRKQLLVITGFIIGLVASFALGNQTANARDTQKPLIWGTSGASHYVVIDTETGCHYMANPQKGGITPRLKSDGSIYCESASKEPS